ncbi:MAG: hypothetical protein HY704_15145 [Gemmatimonadetes bacterium]|nr:hypothetical protein [Gemmatimonadota bacterium]
MRTIGVACASLLLSACLSACGHEFGWSAGDGSFYSRKTLEVIVPFGPGGGTDTWARVIAPHLQGRLGPGSSVQVVNIAGASGVGGANEFALRRRHDGFTLLVSSATPVLSFLLGEPMVRYDFRDFSAILASPAGGVVFVSPKLGVTSAAELPRTGVPIVYGGISPTGTDLIMLVAFELLGLDVKTILGYNSRGATRMAFEQGETNIEFQIMATYLAHIKPQVEQGAVVPLFSFGILDEEGNVVRDPTVPELPSIRDVYVAISGHEPAGPLWEAYKAVLAAGFAVLKVLWVHDDAPPEAIEILRRAAGELTNDPAFLEAARMDVGEYPFYVGETAEQRFAVATDVSPAALEWLRSFLVDQHGVERLRDLRASR